MMKKHNKLRTLFTLSKKDLLYLFEAFTLYNLDQITILLLPFSSYRKKLGIINEESSREIDTDYTPIIGKVAWAVNIVGKYSIWKNKCLAKSMTAQSMLKKRGIESTLYLGVKKAEGNTGKAHAWLRCGTIIVTGGVNMHEYTEVARFYQIRN